MLACWWLIGEVYEGERKQATRMHVSAEATDEKRLVSWVVHLVPAHQLLQKPAYPQKWFRILELMSE